MRSSPAPTNWPTKNSPTPRSSKRSSGTYHCSIQQIYVCEGFLELHGLNMFEEWLTKEEEGVEPSLTLKLRLFKILLELNVNEQHIAYAGELQKIIHKNKRSMVKDLRDLSDAIITKWGRIAYDDINE